MKELLAKLALLEKRAADKLAEIKDNTAADAARAIEKDHEAILAEVSEVRAAIEAAKRDDAGKTDRAADSEAATRARETATSDANEAATRAVANERKRSATINELGGKFGEAEFARSFVNDGKSVEEFRAALIDHLASKEPEVNSNVRAEVGTEHVEKRAAVIESVIMHRVDPSKNELPAGAGEFRGMSLVDMARDILDANGVKTRGMSKVEIASEALSQRAGGMHSTSDFTVILGNTVNRTLRASYEAAPQTFRPLVRETTVSDFKSVTRAQLGEAPQLEKVNEHGEFKRGTIGEGSETYKIATFGKIVGITRQALINDDLGAFTRLAQMFGVQAAQLESDLVWWQILSNPTMGDNVALFHLASHKNLQTAAAFSKTTLSKMRTAMAKQVGTDGKTVLNIRPASLLIPVELEDTAAELLRSTRYPDATTNAVADSLKALSIISEPRIDNGIDNASVGVAVAGSATAHFLAASPASTDTVELAYLEGNRGVYTESKMGFNTDGVEIKVRMDAGAKVIDWRAFQKNAGA
jgi:phage major head subunit gpT-like protein